MEAAFLVCGGFAQRQRQAAVRRHARVRMSAAVGTSAPTPPLTGSWERLAKLPWETSVAGEDVNMLFMPFVQLQNEVMTSRLGNVEELPFNAELSAQNSTKKAARIESWNFRSEEFRKIRLTYIDAGVAAQVFNSVWYPESRYDVPVLGVDFLSFGKKKILCVLDFQPLKQDEEYLKRYIDPLARIKAKYPSLAGKMSARFYDENRFFSPQLVFGRFDNPAPVSDELYPAFEEYLNAYIDTVRRAQPHDDEHSRAQIMQLHKEYDQYSAERDPAVGLFSSYFGPQWAQDFTHNFLFELSTPPSSASEPTADKAA